MERHCVCRSECVAVKMRAGETSPLSARVKKCCWVGVSTDRTSLDIPGRNLSGLPCVDVVAEGTRLEAAIGKKVVGGSRQSDKQMERKNSFCFL